MKKSPKPKLTQRDEANELLFTSTSVDTPPPPEFRALLAKPEVTDHLPSDFQIEAEEKHLSSLWTNVPSLHKYKFERFIHAGGSGMVFRVSDSNGGIRALKIARAKLMQPSEREDTIGNLSPVSTNELRALERISHPYVVRLFEAISNQNGVIAIATTYVDQPKSLDAYLRTTLEKHPDPKRTKGIHPFSPRRLDDACRFLIDRCIEIASALQHMHGLGIFHFDIKPANILLSRGSAHHAMLTDMGACVESAQLLDHRKTRVHFTWTYAHPNLTDIANDPGEISGGGLKASAEVNSNDSLARYDLFAFGKTIQEMLAILVDEFGERCHASYSFRLLHIIACLLLDGRNVAPTASEGSHSDLKQRHGRRFVGDTALGYSTEMFAARKITSARELTERFARFSRQFSWNQMAPELDVWQPELVNSVAHSPAPFTERVAALLNHPAFRRLKDEPQLGWMREVYPGATHDRWSHSLGVFSATVGYFNALLSDPELPTLRILIDREDISHAFVAALLHDLGQTTFGHDFEEACPFLFSHEDVVFKLLSEPKWGASTLGDVLERHWPEIKLERLAAILNPERHKPENSASNVVDGLTRDILKGPIDADKLDYLIRDSIFCGVTYGHGIDCSRFLRALTVSSGHDPHGVKLSLAYKAKGRAAITAVLLARYQMFGSVYWHHTFRCIQAMFVHVVASTFGELEHSPQKLRGSRIRKDEIELLFYHRVICCRSWADSVAAAKLDASRWSRFIFATAPYEVATDRAMEFVWQFAEDTGRNLLANLGARRLYKRAFELRLGELGARADYSAMKTELSPLKRLRIADSLRQQLMDAVHNAMRERGPSSETVSEMAARDRVIEISRMQEPLVILDFPVRGISSDTNTPTELGDAMRKYFVLTKQQSQQDNVFYTVSRLQQHLATLRVFVAPELHELVIRYLHPRKIEGIVQSLIPSIRTH